MPRHSLKKQDSAKTPVHIGTSGWMYKDWGKKFYPKDMKEGFLSFLSSAFTTVEVNTSFYHLPKESTFQKWKKETPPGFIFAVKMSRYITHQKKLQDSYEAVERFLSHAKKLGEKLDVVLIQLPPSLHYEKKKLAQFLRDLKKASEKLRIEPRFALEPRHRSFMEEKNAREIREMLQKQNVALVFPHSSKIPSFEAEDKNVTADFVYIRFHGPSEFAASKYGKRRLVPWARRIENWLRQGLRVFVYFNNDMHGHAIDDARMLRQLLQ